MSLAEAKSLWALTQNREFFMAFVLRNTSLSSPFLGFCGNLFAVESRPSSPLHWLSSPFSWYFSAITPVAQFLWPSWQTRVKHAIALLQLASEIYAYADESFFICDISPASFGVDISDRVKMTGFSHVYSYYELQSLAYNQSCNTDTDCLLVPPDCKSSCDREKHRCRLPQPTIATICTLLKPYLLPRTPELLAVDAAELLNRCSAMDESDANLPLRHEKIIFDLKMLLSRQTSTYNS